MAFLTLLLKASLIYGGLLGTAALMTLAERKVSAWMQLRVGPNRVGPGGLLQPLADGVKFILKEEVTPDGANMWIFRLAPMLAPSAPRNTAARRSWQRSSSIAFSSSMSGAEGIGTMKVRRAKPTMPSTLPLSFPRAGRPNLSSNR